MFHGFSIKKSEPFGGSLFCLRCGFLWLVGLCGLPAWCLLVCVVQHAALVAVIAEWTLGKVLAHLLDVVFADVELVSKIGWEVGAVTIFEDLFVVCALVKGQAQLKRLLAVDALLNVASLNDGFHQVRAG